MGFPDGSVDKEASCNARDTGDVSLIPESGRSPGGEKGNPLQYSCLEKIPSTEEPGGIICDMALRVLHATFFNSKAFKHAFKNWTFLFFNSISDST